MTWKELSSKIASMSDEQKAGLVTVYLAEDDGFFMPELLFVAKTTEDRIPPGTFYLD